MEAEFERIEGERSWQRVFHTIKNTSVQYDYTMKEAKKPENRILNRYRDVSPFDHSRIVLQRSETNYINANLVPVLRANRIYILTQGPLIETLSHFWLMIWEKQSKGIVMLNKLVEKNVLKCHKYWPDKDNSIWKFEALELRVSFIAESAKDSYVCRTFRIEDCSTGESREVLQFHYMNWPDFGVPQSPDDFLDFLQDVRQSGCLEPSVGPPVIHCSAGIGRSGTFCLVDAILKMIEDNRIEESEVNLNQILLDMRRFRMSLVQAAEQLRFSYLAIIEGLRRNSRRSPYLSRKKDEHAPPPPPHRIRALAVGGQTEESSSDSDDHGGGIVDEKLANGVVEDRQRETDQQDNSTLNSDGSPAPVASSEGRDSDSDSGTEPPPLPPKDIPTGEMLEQPPQSEELPNNKVVSNLSDDLHSFEKEILANECMQIKPQPSESNTTPILNGKKESDADCEMLVRKRQHDQSIVQKVQAIKKGIKDAETAHERRSLLENISIGVVVFIGAGILLYRIIDYVKG